MSDPEPAPDPDGEMPDGWRPIEWVAYGALSGGATRRTVAEDVGVGSGTLSSWVRRWRNRYGDDLLASAARANQRRTAADNGSKTAEMWQDRRLLQAARHGAAAAALLDALGSGIERYTADVRAGTIQVTAGDLLLLAKAAEREAIAADRLAGIPDPSRARVQQQNLVVGGAGAPVPAGVVAALEGRASGSDDQKTMIEAARNALKGIQALRPPAETEPPIEVGGQIKQQ